MITMFKIMMNMFCNETIVMINDEGINVCDYENTIKIMMTILTTMMKTLKMIMMMTTMKMTMIIMVMMVMMVMMMMMVMVMTDDDGDDDDNDDDDDGDGDGGDLMMILIIQYGRSSTIVI